MLIVVGWVGKAAPEHEWTWHRLGHEASSFWFLYVGTAVVALLVAAVMFAVGALLRFLWSRLTGVGSWLLPRWIAGGLALVLLTWALLATLNNVRSEEHTSELQSLMRISYAVFCLKKQTIKTRTQIILNKH